MRRGTFWRRRGAAGKARHRQIETAPEEMHRTRLPDEAGTKFIHHAIGLQQGQPEFLSVDRIVLRMGAVPVERYGILYFTRHRPDVNVDSETLEALHEFIIEVGDRLRFERNVFDTAITGLDYQLVMNEVKNDIERSPSIRYCLCSKPARGHQKCCVPPVIDERSERDAHLAD